MFRLFIAAGVLSLAGCSLEVAQDLGATTQGVLTPSLTVWPATGGVDIEYTEMSGGASDWIAIVAEGAPDTIDPGIRVGWAYTGGGASGTVRISVPAGGPYIARAYYDFSGITRQTSSAFTVVNPTSVATDDSEYAFGETITVDFADAPASAETWFTLAPQGSPLTTVLAFRWNTDAVADGTFTFGAPSVEDDYVVRCFRNARYELVVESSPFGVVSPSSPPSITLPLYVDPLLHYTVAFSNFSGSEADWISIAVDGSSDRSFLTNKSFSGVTSGTHTFTRVLTPGNYEARGYFNWFNVSTRFVVQARTDFVVPERTRRLSLDTVGDDPSGDSYFPSISRSDGRYVAFVSAASDLVADDTNGRPDIFRVDRHTGDVVRVSVGPMGEEANGSSNKPWISSNGNFIVFNSFATNLTSDTDANGTVNDIFIHDVSAGSTEHISRSTDGEWGDGDSTYGSVSSDGRYVVFRSASTNLVDDDTNGEYDIFLRDRLLGITERVSVSTDEVEANDRSMASSVSDDGRYVAFMSEAWNLGSTRGRWWSEIYLRDRAAGTTTLVSRGYDGTLSDGHCWSGVRLSASGLYLAYSCLASNLVAGDDNEVRDLFVYDVVQRRNFLVSQANDGTLGNGAVDGEVFDISGGAGRWVVYSSMATNLVSNDTNGVMDVFRRDRLTGTTVRVSVDEDGSQVDDASWRPTISGDGFRVTFESASDALTSDDTNSLADVFVRIP